MADNAPSISTADFESLQRELLRLKHENYELQTQRQRLQKPVNATPDTKSSWAIPRLSNNIANKVSATVKYSLSSRDSQQSLEILSLQAQLKSLQEAHDNRLIQNEETIRQMQREVGQREEDDDRNLPYLIKIQQQQSELDKLRESVEGQEDTIRILRLEMEMTPKKNSQKSLQTKIQEEKKIVSSLKDENTALQSHQQTLASRLTEALSESKEAFQMKCTIQGMGKKLNDYNLLLHKNKDKAARVLMEVNQRWEHERLPMLEEDIRQQMRRHAMRGTPLANAASAICASLLVPPHAPLLSAAGTPTHGMSLSGTPLLPHTPASSSWTSPRCGNGHPSPRVEADAHSSGMYSWSQQMDPTTQMDPITRVDPTTQMNPIILENYKEQVEALQVQVDDLKVEKQIVERRANQKVADLKAALRKKLDCPGERRASPLQHFTIASDDDDVRRKKTHAFFFRRLSNTDDVFSEQGQAKSGRKPRVGTTTGAAQRMPAASPPLATVSPASSSQPPKSPASRQAAGMGDALYLRKIDELETLNAGLQSDLCIARESEALLKEDLEHKGGLITHMLHNKCSVPDEAPAKRSLSAFRVWFDPWQQSKDTEGLEKTLEESIADNIRLRDDIQVLAEQLRKHL
eukprot:GEMP01011836.1.p1 GENE.GEMP01011836.1~~GEMP01011836.1.p1  ORF type:complete len:632 (+),score=163.53 GEMP01011836.1:296-2191(+)